MKKLRKLILPALLTGFLISCSTEPEPIRYGEDACHFCEMTIVSQAHSAQAVSTKGKQFKYDAIECMVNDHLKNETEMAVQQVADFSNPGTMMKVDMARFVINDSIKSPMGANLAALKEKHNSTEGKENLMTWTELKARFLAGNSVTTNH